MNIIVENINEHKEDYSITLSTPGEFYYVVYGYAPVEKTIEVIVGAPNVEAHILGLFIGDSKTCTIHSVQHHRAPNSMSNLHIKSVLSGEADFKYKGIIKIDKPAQQSNAYQQNDNLMLSPKAHVDTKPELEIIANDVKCSHGATIGRLNEEELYYMTARGISREEAYQLALQGFAQDIILKIPSEEVRCTLNQYVIETLGTISNKN